VTTPDRLADFEVGSFDGYDEYSGTKVDMTCPVCGLSVGDWYGISLSELLAAANAHLEQCPKRATS
jgi:hypothetical protein